MYCTGCGRQMQDEDRFCPMCAKPVTGWPPPRRLTRDMQNKKAAGVCSGFARYLGTDLTVMRLIWVVLTLFTGIPIIVYLIAWTVMPADYGPAPQPATVRT